MKFLILSMFCFICAVSSFAQSTKFRKGGEAGVPIITQSRDAVDQESRKLATLTPYFHFDLKSKPYKVTISSDGAYLAVAMRDGNIAIFDLNEKREEFSGEFSPSPLYAAHFHPFQRLIALGDRDGIITVFDMIRRQPIKLIYELTSSVSDVKYSPDGTILAAVHFGGDMTFYETQNYTLIDKIILANASIYGLNFSADSSFFAIGTRANTVKVVEIGAAESATTFKDHSSFVLSCDWSENEWVASGGADSQLFLHHKTAQGWPQEPYFSWIHGDWVTSVKFYRNYLITGSKDGRVRLFDFLNKELLLMFEVPSPVLGIDIQENLMGVITPQFVEVYKINDIVKNTY